MGCGEGFMSDMAKLSINYDKESQTDSLELSLIMMLQVYLHPKDKASKFENIRNPYY